MSPEEQLDFIQRRIAEMNETTAKMVRVTEQLRIETERFDAAKVVRQEKDELLSTTDRVKLLMLIAFVGLIGFGAGMAAVLFSKAIN